MNRLKCISAFILGILGWILGIAIGVLWVMIYGGYKESNVIDITEVLAENIAPALVSVFLSNYIFEKVYPDIPSKNNSTIVFYILLILGYGYMICSSIITNNYSNLIYVATGILTTIYLLFKKINFSDNKNN